MATKKNKRFRRIISGALILAIVAGTGAVLYLRNREVVIPIQTEFVKRRNLTELVVANGRIQPVVQVKISPEVSGEIIDLPVKKGRGPEG